ncbi:MAG: hypothetical protein ACD_46C00089G0004 [uncultured bacterium]|nr:MAG: hypothetical protein ACD_46C00089G0004 [uncultured bacterium]
MKNIKKIIENQRKFFATGTTFSLDFRLQQLKKLREILENHEAEIVAALQKDLHKHPSETLLHEVMILMNELRYTIKNLKKWAHTSRTRTPFPLMWPGKSTISYEPHGCALIIGAWNFPLLLTLLPLIGAMSAGNCCIVKPSEIAIHTQSLIQKLISAYFPPEYIAVITADANEMENVLSEKYDYIFFTGSARIGKKILAGAAQHLTPVTLELGGKSPCIIDESANIPFAAQRIIWGKFLNAGQTCIAPDYLYVHESRKTELIEQLIKTLIKFYGQDAKQSDCYGRIINQTHLQRLKLLLQSGEILFGGAVCDETRYIAPTLIDDISWQDAIMQEEIFGPLLPILTFNHVDQVIKEVNQHPQPLALYLFTQNKQHEKKIIKQIAFGTGCINDCIMQIANHYLPFGGVGQSGMGKYHGKTSFETFSQRKSIYKKNTLVHIKWPYPPHTKNKLWWLRKLLRF